jgi:parallel beta-helix repeat protein
MSGAGAGSTTTHNHVRASNYDGVRVEESNGVSVEDNKITDNGYSGILLTDSDNNTVGDNKVKNNGSASNDLTSGDGIRVEMTSANNTIENNHLKDNVTHDCHDNSVGTGTAGTANSWIDNHGETENKPGLCTKDPDDDAAFETSTMYGWDPSYPWYNGLDIASEYDWAATYSTIDTESLLELLPEIRVGGIHRGIVSP